jgi:hypothetical protein
MKQFSHFLLASITLIFLLSSVMQGQIPKTISFQGVLTDSIGKPVGDGQWGLTFRLYDDSTEGTQLWNESKVLQTNRGLFSTILGDVIPFGTSVQFDKPYWLAIQAGGQPEMALRIPLTAVGYSIHSGKSDTAKYAESVAQQKFVDSARVSGTIAENSITNLNIIDGTIGTEDIAPTFTAPYSDTAMYARNTANIPVTDSARIAGTVPDGSLTKIKIANAQVVKSLNSLKDDIILAAEGGATITSSGDTIKINAGSGGGGTGIQGVQNTDASLTITDPNGPTATINVANLGIKGAQIANAAITPAKLNSAGAGVGQAMIWNGSNVIWGNPDGGLLLPYVDSTSSSSAAAFQIINSSTTGSAYGVYGKSNSTSGVGVRGYAPRTGVSGYASNTTGTTYAFYGETPSTSGYGVFGAATASSGTTYGVYGRSYSDDGYGIYGRAPLYGVYGLASATSGINYGLYGTSSSVWGRGVYGSGQLYGVEGRATATDVENYGVYGSSASTIGYGVYGVNVASSGSNFGVYGESYSTSGRGVQGISPYLGTYGRSEMTTGLSYGVYGRCNSTDGYGVYGTSPSIGVYGVSTATSGEKVGVYGRTYSAEGSGVWGHGIDAGVVGTSTGSYGAAIIGYGNANGGNAATFNGFVAVMGTLYKSAGSFKIDHPLDPENKYLYHSFVESPDMKNIYDGVVVLDANGSASVTLPDWFGALNKDFRYQLTAIGGPSPNLYISSEIENNTFKIAGGSSGIKVSWQVTGTRKDAYAEKNRIPVEEDKVGDELGKYLHPEAYGQPREEGIPFMQMPSMLKNKLMLQKANPDPDATLLKHQAPPQSDQE